MAKAPKKLNSMRLLETHGVDYTVYEFSDAIHNAEEVADAVGVPREIV